MYITSNDRCAVDREFLYIDLSQNAISISISISSSININNFSPISAPSQQSQPHLSPISAPSLLPQPSQPHFSPISAPLQPAQPHLSPTSAISASSQPPSGPSQPSQSPFWSMRVPKCYYLQHSGTCVSQNAIINSILAHACPQILLITLNNPFLELIPGIPGIRGNGVSRCRTDPPKQRAGVLG